MATERLVTLEEFRVVIENTNVSRRIDEVVVHHTWKPSAADYRGIETVRGVRRYHVGVRGWSDNGYHVMFGPDGSIFLCRPIARAGAHVAGRNARTIGVSFIADFDAEDPTRYEGMQAGMQAVAVLLDRFNLTPEDIRFHREFAPKTCPGTKKSLSNFRAEVGRYMYGEDVPSKVARKVVVLPGYENAMDPIFHEGAHYVAVRDVAAAFGHDLIDRRDHDGKLYLRKRAEITDEEDTG